MIHGSQKLKHLDFSQTTVIAPPGRMPNRGRNPELLSRRNKRIISRYYYWNAIKKKNVSCAIELLMFEFDLDSYTLAQIINKEEAAITH